jgi:hypothetical protein
MLDDKQGDDLGLKSTNLCCLCCYLCCTGLTGALHRSDRCLLADESRHVISLKLYLSGLENICVSATVYLNLIVIIKRLFY